MNHINKRFNLKAIQKLTSSNLKLLSNYSISTDLLLSLVNNNTQNIQYYSNKPNEDRTLQNYLKSKIKMKGPITVSEFMKEALSNPYHGYYMKHDVFGSKGDFITAPEVSQLFGELIGVWFLNEWLLLKSMYGKDLPDRTAFIELGPGRGTLMADILRVWSKNSKSSKQLFVYMVEVSPAMRKIQCKNLCNIESEPQLLKSYKSKLSNSIEITWVQDLNEIPKNEAVHFYLANEFFDALPIHKFQKTSAGYREILVDFDEKENRFKYVLSPSQTVASKVIINLHPTYSKFDHVEISVEAARVIESISRSLNEYNGSVLIADYGHDGDLKDTLRGFKSHRLESNVLKNPGECDLTVDVDFSFLKHVAKKSNVSVYGPINQCDFLKQMHINSRIEMLLKKCKDDEDRKKLISDMDMLINPNKMGSRFKMISMRKFDFKQNPIGFSQ